MRIVKMKRIRTRTARIFQEHMGIVRTQKDILFHIIHTIMPVVAKTKMAIPVLIPERIINHLIESAGIYCVDGSGHSN